MDPADSANAGPHLTAEAGLFDAAVSPDGSLAAYTSDETGTREVYVRSFPTARQPVKVSKGLAAYSRWAPDGNTLYYWSPTPTSDTLLAARVQRTPTFAVLSTETLFAAEYVPYSWDLHPDGDRVVVPRSVGSASAAVDGLTEPEQFLVVTNWFAELRAALGDN